MGILEEIQNGLVEEHPIGPLLLKLRLLSARLGSDALEKWVTHEAEGYPQTADLPEYRVLGVSFSGHFNGPFGSSISNAPIPPHLIGKLAGKHWEHFRLRDSAASIDEMARSGDGLHLDFSNLILAVQGKIYGKYACNSIAGFVSRVALVEAANAIRGRLLQLTIEIERKIPKAKGVEMSRIPKSAEQANQIVYQTVYGTANTGTGAIQSVNITHVGQGDKPSLAAALSVAGFAQSDIPALVEAIADSKPGGDGANKKVKSWIAGRLTKGVDIGIQGGVAAATSILQDVAMRYWGLK
ncbi:MAG: hypothetical protein V4753_03750 [Pseudomonadota bacterium]